MSNKPDPLPLKSTKPPTLVGKSAINTALLERMQIPEIHWKATLDAVPIGCKHKKVIHDYLDFLTENIKSAKGLLLFGPFGAGKSALAAICLKAAASKGFIGLWIKAERVPEIQIEKIPFDEEMNLYERALTVPILVLDELKLKIEIKGVEQYVEMFIRRRLDDKLCTIITTNHTPDIIKERYPALFSPLTEMVFPVKVDGHNFRSVKAKECN